MTVPTPVKLYNLFPSSKTPRQSYSGHGSLGTRTHHTHLLHRGHHFNYFLGQFSLVKRGSPETRAISAGGANRLHNPRMRMAKNQRAPRAYVVYVFIPIDIPDVCTFTPLEKTRATTYCPKCTCRAIHPPRNKLLGLFKSCC